MAPMGGSQIAMTFIGGILVFFVVVFLVVRRMERKRTQAMRAAALRLGLQFLEDGDALKAEKFFVLPLFNQGRAKTFSNVVRNDKVTCFGYRYTIGSGKSRTQVIQSVAAYHLPGRDLPAFELKPEGMFDRFVNAFGGQDFDFHDDPEFSRAFRLQGLGEQMIRKLFGVDLRRALVAAPGWSIEGDGEWVVLYKKKVRMDPTDLTGFLRETELLTSHFPKN
jgi:hypothetical protein